MNLWNHTPGLANEVPTITCYKPKEKKTDMALIAFPGGGYVDRAPYEGAGYAEFFANAGITAFAVAYRVAPHSFPLPLLDARRAVRWVRAHAAEYGIDPQKIAVIGSSAGGHLAAMLSTYREGIDFEGTDEIDREDYIPNAQILCYPVIADPTEGAISHADSYWNLIGSRDVAFAQMLSPICHVSSDTPPAFIWHTSDDELVNVINSYRYGEALRRQTVPTELHVFPHGRHGMGVAADDPHVAQWTTLVLNWFHYLGWM